MTSRGQGSSNVALPKVSGNAPPTPPTSKEDDISMQAIDQNFKDDKDPIFMKNQELIHKQLDLKQKVEDDLTGDIEEMNHTFEQLFQLNHIQ